MSRTIELGRAVLSSPTTSHELWLTTLITISPQQNSTNIEQYNPPFLLDLLSSGSVWVGRGNGLHIDLNLTLRGEPLGDRHLQELANRIVEAPVWEQLKLRPSIPIGALIVNGTLVINIGHADDDGSSETKAPHRILPNVPAADLRPPKNVSKFNLDLVHFSMEIVETKQRLRPKNLKRLKTVPNDNETIFSQLEALGKGGNDGTDEILCESSAAPNLLQPQGSTSARLDVAPHGNQKRKRPSTHISVKKTSLPLRDSIHSRPNHRQPSAQSDLQPSTLAVSSASDWEDMDVMIDGALRLSACGTLIKRSANGVKVKASTFGQGLMEVAPILWSPGYMLALSQRAHLIPVISRSFSQTGCFRATSKSLKHKVARFAVNQTTDENPGTTVMEPSLGQLSSSLSGRLWLHLQKNLMCRPTTVLQAFVGLKQQSLVSAEGRSAGQQETVEDATLPTILMHKSGAGNRELLYEGSRIGRVGSENSLTEEFDHAAAEHDRQDAEIVDDLLLSIDTGSAASGANISLCAYRDVLEANHEVEFFQFL